MKVSSCREPWLSTGYQFGHFIVSEENFSAYFILLMMAPVISVKAGPFVIPRFFNEGDKLSLETPWDSLKLFLGGTRQFAF